MPLARSLISILLALIALALLTARALESGASHDEHQFIVPGLLTLREGLLPYRDYPLFHVPYLVLVHGALGSVTGYPLLSARVLSAVAAWLTVLLLALHVARRFPGGGGARMAAGVATAGLVLFQPVFSYTALFAWNHAVPTLLAVVAFLMVVQAASSPRPAVWLFGSGAVLALTIGMRLSWAPMLAPFGLAALLLPGRTWRNRGLDALCFSAGAVLAAAPLVWMWAQAPEAAWFGNFGYPKLSVIWRKYPIWHDELQRFVDADAGFLNPLKERVKGRGLGEKLGKFARSTMVDNWTFFAVVLPLVIGGVVAAVRARTSSWSLRWAWLALPFVLWGTLAPSRFHTQYQYALLPFLALLAAESLPLLEAVPGLRRALPILGGAGALLAAALNARDYRAIATLTSPERLGVLIDHRAAEELRRQVGDGLVLTMNALAAAEQRVPIYAEFSSGEFPWRVSHLLPREKRERVHLVSPFDLEAFAARRPPAALFIEEENKLSEPLVAYARAHGYTPSVTIVGWKLWRAPGG